MDFDKLNQAFRQQMIDRAYNKLKRIEEMHPTVVPRECQRWIDEINRDLDSESIDKLGERIFSDWLSDPLTLTDVHPDLTLTLTKGEKGFYYQMSIDNDEVRAHILKKFPSAQFVSKTDL